MKTITKLEQPIDCMGNLIDIMPNLDNVIKKIKEIKEFSKKQVDNEDCKNFTNNLEQIITFLENEDFQKKKRTKNLISTLPCTIKSIGLLDLQDDEYFLTKIKAINELESWKSIVEEVSYLNYQQNSILGLFAYVELQSTRQALTFFILEMYFIISTMFVSIFFLLGIGVVELDNKIGVLCISIIIGGLLVYFKEKSLDKFFEFDFLSDVDNKNDQNEKGYENFLLKIKDCSSNAIRILYIIFVLISIVLAMIFVNSILTVKKFNTTKQAQNYELLVQKFCNGNSKQYQLIIDDKSGNKNLRCQVIDESL